MKAKKVLAALGVTSVLIGSVLAGCGNSDQEQKTTAKDGKKVEVTLAGWGSTPAEKNY